MTPEILCYILVQYSGVFMDQRLSQALEFANYRQTLYLEQRRLKEKAKASLTFVYNGGRFFVDRNLIAFLNGVTPQDESNSIVIFDDAYNPILIEDLAKFRRDVINIYCSAANQHYQEISELKKKRTVTAVVGL